MEENPHDQFDEDLPLSTESAGGNVPTSESPVADTSVATEIIDGELVVAPPVALEKAESLKPKIPAPPVAEEFEGIAANGGAVGATVLGIWAILGSFLTHWSIINGFLGLVLGIWGLTSKRPRLAWIGIILCVIGCFLSMISISEFVSAYFEAWTDDGY